MIFLELVNEVVSIVSTLLMIVIPVWILSKMLEVDKHTRDVPPPVLIESTPKKSKIKTWYWLFRFWLRDFVNKHFPEDKK